MRRISCIITFLFMTAFILMCAGCTEKEEAVVDVTKTPAASLPVNTPEAQTDNGYSISTVTIFFPEGTSDADAEYQLTYSIPVFPESALNDAINRFVEELTARVTEERMPLADRAGSAAIPYTLVEFEVRKASNPAGSYTNILFTETASYDGSDSETVITTLVLDALGSECGLAKISGVYAPDALVAQQVWNIIALDPGNYYGDLALEDIVAVLDLYNGFTVAEEGYTVYVRPGKLADQSLEFSFARSALYPEFVGDILDAEEYESLLPAINATATACAPNYDGFVGTPSDAVATAFLRTLLLGNAPVSTISWDDYTACAARHFGDISITKGAAGADPGTEIAGDNVNLTAAETAYGLQCEDATIENGTLSIVGVLMYGKPGSSNTGVIGPAAITLEQAGDGWHITAFEIR